MNDEELLLKAVVANPEDDTARLVYADAVQERDEILAALIRIGVPCHCTRPDAPIMPSTMRCTACDGREWLRRCEHECCRDPGQRCVVEGHVNGERDDVEEFFCAEHAHAHGYCHGCGWFYAGIDAFDFSPSGLCSACQDQLDEGDEDEWDGDIDGITEYGEDEL